MPTTEIDLYKLVNTLIGPIKPVGDAHDDTDRLENLNNLISLLDALLSDVASIYYNNKDSELMSKLDAAKCSSSFFDSIRVDLDNSKSQHDYRLAYDELQSDIVRVIKELQELPSMEVKNI